MLSLPQDERGTIRNLLSAFRDHYAQGDYALMTQGRPYLYDVPEIRNVFVRIDEFIKELDNQLHNEFIEVHETFIPCLKAVFLHFRQREKKRIERYMEEARSPLVMDIIQERLKPFDDLLNRDELKNTDAMRLPRITDYLSIREMEEGAHKYVQTPQRFYDEKFGILQAPKQLLIDLPYYREMCRIRGTSLAVAYIDIDDFKNFNTSLLEVNVDHFVLPRFMETLESHVYMHGFAYRYGGDEYVVLLPNVAIDLTVIHLEMMRKRIELVEYPNTQLKTTISIGFILIEPDSPLTDRESVEKANKAKEFAKKSGGKNCLATFSGTRFNDEDLMIVTSTWKIDVKLNAKS